MENRYNQIVNEMTSVLERFEEQIQKAKLAKEEVKLKELIYAKSQIEKQLVGLHQDWQEEMKKKDSN